MRSSSQAPSHRRARMPPCVVIGPASCAGRLGATGLSNGSFSEVLSGRRAAAHLRVRVDLRLAGRRAAAHLRVRVDLRLAGPLPSRHRLAQPHRLAATPRALQLPAEVLVLALKVGDPALEVAPCCPPRAALGALATRPTPGEAYK